MIPRTVWRWALVLGGWAVCAGVDLGFGIWKDSFLPFFPFLLSVILLGTIGQTATAVALTIAFGFWSNSLHPTGTTGELIAGCSMIVLVAGALTLSIHHVRRLLREKDSLIVQERQARTRAEEAYLAQLDAERKRDRLVQDAAHQLRTPLTVLGGYAQLLAELEEVRARKGGGSQGATTSAVVKIVRAAQDMDAIVQDILDAARLPQGGADAWEGTLDPERPLPPDNQS